MLYEVITDEGGILERRMEEFHGIRKQEVGRHRGSERQADRSEMASPEPGGDQRDHRDA